MSTDTATLCPYCEETLPDDMRELARLDDGEFCHQHCAVLILTTQNRQLRSALSDYLYVHDSWAKGGICHCKACQTTRTLVDAAGVKA